jgi:hypothetical protein
MQPVLVAGAWQLPSLQEQSPLHHDSPLPCVHSAQDAALWLPQLTVVPGVGVDGVHCWQLTGQCSRMPFDVAQAPCASHAAHDWPQGFAVLSSQPDGAAARHWYMSAI